VLQTSSSPVHDSLRSFNLRAALAALLTLFLCALSLHAQAKPCTAADLDVVFRYGSYPPSTYVITVVASNISTHTCTLTPDIVPRFYAANGTTPAPVVVRLDGNNLIPESHPPIPLTVGQAAHLTINWVIFAAGAGPACTQTARLSIDVNGDRNHSTELLAPSLLPSICSEVAVGSYAVGTMFDAPDSSPASDSTLRLSANQATYVSGVPFSLHLDFGNTAPNVDTGESIPCPTFLLRQRTSAGATRTIEYSSPLIRCTRETCADPDLYLTTEFESVHPLQGSGSGDTTLQVFQLTGHAGDLRVGLAKSNLVTLHFTPALIQTGQE
jgi:hypothetical protein